MATTNRALGHTPRARRSRPTLPAAAAARARACEASNRLRRQSATARHQIKIKGGIWKISSAPRRSAT